MEQRTDAAESRKKKEGLDPFERFVELSTKVISRAPFFAVVVAIVVIWAASYPLWKSTTKWELAIHTFGAVLSLLLLVLLENAGRRNTEAMQEKLKRHRRGARRADGLTRCGRPRPGGGGGRPPRGRRARGAPLIVG